jgi:hypothetical protein
VIRPLVLAIASTLWAAVPVAAQGGAVPQTGDHDTGGQPSGEPQFLSRFAFQVGLEHMYVDDPRFVWDAHWGAELDLVDYGRGALTFAAAYQTVLGNQFREFDPNQGDYTLEGSASARTGAVEMSGVFHHVSRHLSDRPKRFPIDWNMIGGRIRGHMLRGRTDVQARVDLRGVIQKSFVDYEWELASDTRSQVRLTRLVSLVALGDLRVVGVDESRNRDTVYGWRADGGVRFDGHAAALELFIAAERRIDPYQLEFSTATWLVTGFRLASR